MSREEREQRALLGGAAPREKHRVQFEDTKTGRILHVVFPLIFLPLLVKETILWTGEGMRDALNQSLSAGERIFGAVMASFVSVWYCILAVLLMCSTRHIFGRRNEPSPDEETAVK